MLDEIIKILNDYLSNLDREYDHDSIILTEQLISSISSEKENIAVLLSAIPNDVPASIVEKLKLI